MSQVSIDIGAETASDSWGFVGVVTVGEVEAYRTLEAFPTPSDAERATQQLVASVVGELLAGVEWRRVRNATGATPTRRALALEVLKSQLRGRPRDLSDA